MTPDIIRINSDLAPADQNPVAVYLASMSEGSRRSVLSRLNQVAGISTDGAVGAETFPWHQLRYEHTAAIRAELSDRYMHSTANAHLSALKGVMNTCQRLGLISVSQCQRAIDLPPVRGESLLQGRALDDSEIKALFRACERDPKRIGRRDTAIIAVLYGSGLRRAELVNLRLEDFMPHRRALKVKGKGRKYRVVPMMNGSARAVFDWIRIRGKEPGPLFTRLGITGQVSLHRICEDSIYRVIEKRSIEAAIAHCSPHDLRRTLTTNLLRAGVDVFIVQAIMGHASLTTTQQYDERQKDEMFAAADVLTVPYRRPARFIRGADGDRHREDRERMNDPR